MEISFESITVKTKAGKELLSNVTGICQPGTFTSLMGSSGSGKTTLLSVLSRRFEASLFYTGLVRYNGRKWNPHDRRCIAFVQQDDIVPPYLTVEDFLMYSARLRLDATDEVRKERVEKVIAKLRLQKCRGTQIGGIEARGVSGGERKRTSIANELLTEPLVVFTDEPTSGLDSTLSTVVIDILKGLADEGLTVVTTIHSPSSSIFDKFDSLIVLDEGRVFYRGHAKDLVRYLSETLGRTVPAQFNPADFLLDVLVLDKESLKDQKVVDAMASFMQLDSASASTVSHDEVDEQTQLARKSMTKRKSTMSTRGKQMLRSVSVIFRPGDEDVTDNVEKKYARSFLVQVFILTSRLWNKYRRDVFTANQIGSTIGLSAISGLLYFQIGFTEQEIFSRVALALWLVGTDMYLGVFSTSFALQDDIPLVKKELYDGSYSLAAHVVAKQIVLYPTNGLWSVVFCTLVLLCTRLSPSVGLAVLIILAVQAEIFLFQGVGFFLSAAVPTSGLVVVVVVVVTFFFAFNGFFAPFNLMAPWYGWLRYPCFLQYSYQLVMHIAFSDSSVTYSCGSPSSYTVCTNNGSVITGGDVLKQWNVDLTVTTCILVLIFCGFAVRILAYYAYSWRMRPPKGISNEQSKDRRSFPLCCCRRKQTEPSKSETISEKKDTPATDVEKTVQVV